MALGADNTVTTIIDNDTATWSITGETSVTEDPAVNNTASYTVTLAGALQANEDASIVLSLTNNTTNPNGSDLATAAQFDAAVQDAVTAYNNGSDPGSLSYDNATNKLTFLSDGTGAMGNLVINLTAVNDPLVEGPETYTVALATPTSTTGSAIALGADNTVTTIIDNDTATWSITGETSVTEDPAVNNTASYTVTLAGALQANEDASIVLSLTNNTTNPNGSDLATAAQFDAAVQDAVTAYNAGSDPGSLSYDNATNKLTFLSDGTGAMGNLVINLTAVNDPLVEGPETYTVALATPTSTTGSAIALGADNTVTTIIDNDTATWSITGETSVTEDPAVNNTASYTVTLAGALQANEDASIVLSLTNNTTNPNGSDLATAAQFDAAVQDAVTAYNNGSDPGSLSYDNATNKLTFLSDGTGAMGNLVINLTAVNDPLVEGPETYTVALATPTSTTGSAIALGADNTVTTIIDNDTATWSITGETSVTEDPAVNNTASYTVTLAGALQANEDASIVLSLTNNTTNPNGSDLATAAQFDAAVQDAVTAYNAGSDPGSLSYDNATNKLTFLSDGTGAMGNLVINLTAVNDPLVEGPETYTVALATPTSTTGSAIALGADNTVTTIIDNDTATWSITGETSVTED